MLRISVLFFSLLFLAACSTTKLPTSDQLSQMEYREVRGLFDVSESQEKPDKMPMYPKGNNGLITDIQNQVEYPQKAKEDDQEGIVIVSFTITDKGELKKPEIDRGVLKIINGGGLGCKETIKPLVSRRGNRWAGGSQLQVFVTFRKPV